MVMRRITLENFCKKKAKSFVFRGMMAEVSGRAECELHPLIHIFGFWASAQNAGVVPSGRGLNISCQYVNFYYFCYMKSIFKLILLIRVTNSLDCKGSAILF
jgi:hypothetical protein